MQKFGLAAPVEEKIEKNLIEASQVTHLRFGKRIATTCAWHACRAQMGGAAASSFAAVPKLLSKMPGGVEAILRGKWKETHGFNIMGHGL